MDAELTEEVVVESDKLYLTDGRKELALLYTVERVVDGQLSSSACHGTR